ncbi:MAG: GNAT family N-acetyltransferase [Bacteroidetes bacterium]|nr:GNAT family N-acetyltransferase [Bacteroidota bacterium]
MGNIQIKTLDKNNALHVAEVTRLFADYYMYFHELGIDLPLIPNGEIIWMQSVLPSLDRLACLPVAVMEEHIIGFAHGSIKLLPSYLGENKVGVVQHVYVPQAHTGMGIARRLVETLENWFDQKQVHSIELQVIRGNTNAALFWKKLGYHTELEQFRKIL